MHETKSEYQNMQVEQTITIVTKQTEGYLFNSYSCIPATYI
jgi:hypothetical protein